MTGNVRQYAAGVAGITLIFITYYLVTWRSFTEVIYAFSGMFCDFVTYYYPMGEVIFHDGLPVSGFLYSPFIAMLLAAFHPLGFTASLVIWGILQIILVFIYITLFRRLVETGLPVQLLFAALVLSSFPVALNFLGGQVSLFMMTALLGMLILTENNRLIPAAGLHAFAVSFKFYPVIFIAPFAARKDIRILLLIAAACSIVLFIFPGILLGPSKTVQFYGTLFESFRESEWVTANPHSQYFPHVVLRFAELMGHDVHARLPLIRWISYAIAAANLGLIILIQRARMNHADLWSFQIIFLTIPFVLKTSWPHDFVFVPLTQALLFWRLIGGENQSLESGNKTTGSDIIRRRENLFRLRSVIVLFLLFLSIVFSNVVFFNLLHDFYHYGSYGFLFWADLALLIVVYVEFLPFSIRSIRRVKA